MKWARTLLIVFAGTFALTQSSTSRHSSVQLLFQKSDSAAALHASAIETRRNALDLNAWFIRMEAARLQLRQDEELKYAIELLSLAKGEDPRARLAAERIRELAANSPIFRSALPSLLELLQRSNPYQQDLSAALLNAAKDGLPLPTRARLSRRLRHWHIAGPFGELSNVDFDRSWPPEHDQLRSASYEGRRRETVDSEAGELAFPDYFTRPGIYYATSDFVVSAGGLYKFTIESDGTYVLQVDDKQLVVHDARFRQQSSVSRAEMHLAPGRHHLCVKLQLATLPMRVWFDIATPHGSNAPVLESAEAQYLKAASALDEGSLDAALSLPAKSHAITEILRADALSRAGLDEQARTSYETAADLDPNNSLAQFHLASDAYASQNFDGAISYLSKILKSVPAFWPAQELKYEVAEHFNWAREREEALAVRLRLHPTCSAFIDATNFYDSVGNRERGAYFQSKLATCSPTPYQYWEQLSFHGDHARALASISRYLVRHPNDRHALTSATREAVLAGDRLAAQRCGYALLVRAPNLPRVQKIARNPDEILDSRSAYGNAGDFYRPFVRDALPMMSTTPFPPSDSEVLVNDRVVKLNAEGAWIYQHTVTQVFDKKGIESAGELELPHGMDLLELRTIKRNGAFVEPEISDNKDSVSMPSLEEGDAVETSYLQHVNSTSLASSPELLDFVFGSSDSPTRSAQFTVIRDLSTPEPQLWHSAEVRKLSVRRLNGSEIATWQAASLPAPPREPDGPTWERRARILFLALDSAHRPDIIAHDRDELIHATRITPRIEHIAATLQQRGAREQIAAAYQLIMTTIQDESANWRQGSITSADETFQQGEGNRASALIALISALGFNADLELAAERSTRNPDEDCAAERCYAHPLVRVRLSETAQPILLDPVVNGLATGALSPEVEGERALIVSRTESSTSQTVTAASTADERSVAHAQLELNENGDLSGMIHVRFGSIRGAQMREALRQLSTKDRREYLEEIAQRLFPHARDVSGSVVNEENPEKPLDLDLKIEAPGFAQYNGSELELGQLVPALALSKLYATLPERRDDLLLETPLIESSDFTVRLSSGMEVKHLPQSVSLKTAFGEYKTKFEFEPGSLKIVRSFRILAQIVAPDKYPAFSDFALDIDRAERELIRLHRSSSTQTSSNSSMLTLH